MKKDSIIDKHVENIISNGIGKSELYQTTISNIIFSLKKMSVLSEKIKKQLLNNKLSMNEIRLIALGVKIEMINSEIEKIKQEYLP